MEGQPPVGPTPMPPRVDQRSTRNTFPAGLAPPVCGFVPRTGHSCPGGVTVTETREEIWTEGRDRARGRDSVRRGEGVGNRPTHPHPGPLNSGSRTEGSLCVPHPRLRRDSIPGGPGAVGGVTTTRQTRPPRQGGCTGPEVEGSGRVLEEVPRGNYGADQPPVGSRLRLRSRWGPTSPGCFLGCPLREVRPGLHCLGEKDVVTTGYLGRRDRLRYLRSGSPAGGEGAPPHVSGPGLFTNGSFVVALPLSRGPNWGWGAGRLLQGIEGPTVRQSRGPVPAPDASRAGQTVGGAPLWEGRE